MHEGCLLDILIMRLFNQTLSMYACLPQQAGEQALFGFEKKSSLCDSMHCLILLANFLIRPPTELHHHHSFRRFLGQITTQTTSPSHFPWHSHIPGTQLLKLFSLPWHFYKQKQFYIYAYSPLRIVVNLRVLLLW